jgi:hypothetical protein
MIDVSEFIQNIPLSWKEYLQSNVEEFVRLFEGLKAVSEGKTSEQTADRLQRWRTAIEKIDRFYDECLSWSQIIDFY